MKKKQKNKKHLHSCETEDNIRTGILGPMHGSTSSTWQWCEPPISHIRYQIKEDKKTFAAEELYISFCFYSSQVEMINIFSAYYWLRFLWSALMKYMLILFIYFTNNLNDIKTEDVTQDFAGMFT